MKKWIALIILLPILGFVVYNGIVDYRRTSPHLYRSAQSADGAHTVNLYRNYRDFGLVSPVDITVRVFDRQSKLIFEQRIYIVDGWWQAEPYAGEIKFEGKKIKIGPGTMYADGPGEFVIDNNNFRQPVSLSIATFATCSVKS